MAFSVSFQPHNSSAPLQYARECAVYADDKTDDGFAAKRERRSKSKNIYRYLGQRKSFRIGLPAYLPTPKVARTFGGICRVVTMLGLALGAHCRSSGRETRGGIRDSELRCPPSRRFELPVVYWEKGYCGPNHVWSAYRITRKSGPYFHSGFESSNKHPGSVFWSVKIPDEPRLEAMDSAKYLSATYLMWQYSCHDAWAWLSPPRESPIKHD